MELPLRAQGTILTAIRGCDLTPKMPLDRPERQIVGWIRGRVLNPADPREIGIKGAFFQNEFPVFKWSEFGHYPLHWVSHVAHTLEVISAYHPDVDIKTTAWRAYADFCHSLHVNPETSEQQLARLTEDRIANNTVVS